MHVDHVWRDRVEKATDDPLDGRVSVAVLEPAPVAKRVVDEREADAVALLMTDRQVRTPRVGLAGEDDDLILPVAIPKGAGEIVRIDLDSTDRRRRHAVNDLKGTHQTPRNLDGCLPRRAARAPRYCPRGNATASPSALTTSRAGRGRPDGQPARHRTWARVLPASATRRCRHVGIVDRPNREKRR